MGIRLVWIQSVTYSITGTLAFRTGAYCPDGGVRSVLSMAPLWLLRRRPGSLLSRWRWLSPGFSRPGDSPVTNWSQSIYLVTEFQLDCDRGDTGERRAEVKCKDEYRQRGERKKWEGLCLLTKIECKFIDICFHHWTFLGTIPELYCVKHCDSYGLNSN